LLQALGSLKNCLCWELLEDRPQLLEAEAWAYFQVPLCSLRKTKIKIVEFRADTGKERGEERERRYNDTHPEKWWGGRTVLRPLLSKSYGSFRGEGRVMALRTIYRHTGSVCRSSSQLYSKKRRQGFLIGGRRKRNGEAC